MNSKMQFTLLRTSLGVKVELPANEYFELEKEAKEQKYEHILPSVSIETELRLGLYTMLQNPKENLLEFQKTFRTHINSG